MDLIQNAFPDYPVDSLPLIPPGWLDTSWCNDTSPSVQCHPYHCWIDYPDDADREVPGGHQYIVCLLDEEGCLANEQPVLETDDWEAVLRLVQGHQR